MKKLNPRERLFVAEYLIDLDPTRAALAAGYTRTMARSKAFQWVSNSKHKPHVYAEIQERLKEKTDKLELKAEAVLKAIINHASHDPRKLFNKGTMKDIEELDIETAQTITGFDFVNLYEGEGEQKHVFVRIPGQGDRDSEIIPIRIPKLIRSRFRDEGDHGFRF